MWGREAVGQTPGRCGHESVFSAVWECVCMCARVCDSAREDGGFVHSWPSCVCEVGRGISGRLGWAGAEVEGMWWVREEPRQPQACYL